MLGRSNSGRKLQPWSGLAAGHQAENPGKGRQQRGGGGGANRRPSDFAKGVKAGQPFGHLAAGEGEASQATSGRKAVYRPKAVSQV